VAAGFAAASTVVTARLSRAHGRANSSVSNTAAITVNSGGTTLTDAALALGKPVAISEAWLSKERDSEFTQYNAATDQTIFSRDAFAFWAPLDQAFLGALVKFAHWKHLLYLSPFWTTRFHAYVDYQPGLSPALRAGRV